MHTNYIFNFDKHRYCIDYFIQPNGEVHTENEQVIVGDEWQPLVKRPKGWAQHLEDMFSEEIERKQDDFAADHNDTAYFARKGY